MGVNLEIMSRKELVKLRDAVEKAIVNAEKKERQKALQAAEKAAAEFGFSLAELSGDSPRSAKGSKTKAKYRNPTNPEQTWSGRGRKPQWYHDAVKNGVDAADLEI